MPVELWIDDGNPWYLSPDIWVVPSDDPNDPPGLPFEGVSAFVWSRVHNRGTTSVSNATVRVYWADPSTVITRASANLIGTSSVSLAAGETKDVLCVTPWIPAIVNNGHECLIAEAFAPSDPLPPHAATDPINVAGDRHVAQRNIDVGQASAGMMIVRPFRIAGHGRRTLVRVERAKLAVLEALLPTIGLERLPEEAPRIGTFGLLPYRCGEQIDEVGEEKLELQLEPGQQRAMAFAARLPEKLPPGSGALFLVEQLDEEDAVVGGIAMLVLAGAAAEEDPPKRRPRRKPAAVAARRKGA